MNEPELKLVATGFTVKKNPLEQFVMDLAMREGQLIQHFFSQVVGQHFPPHFIELYAIDMKQIPGLNMTLRCEPYTRESQVIGEVKNLSITWKGRVLGSCRLIHRDYPQMLVVSLVDARIEPCPPFTSPKTASAS